MEESFDYKNLQEERWNAITHAIGFLLSIPALVLLILKGVKQGTGIAITSFTIFGVSMLLLFLASTLLHSMPVKLKSFFAILDHSAIYVLIAGTYTPFLLVTLKGALGWDVIRYHLGIDLVRHLVQDLLYSSLRQTITCPLSHYGLAHRVGD